MLRKSVLLVVLAAMAATSVAPAQVIVTPPGRTNDIHVWRRGPAGHRDFSSPEEARSYHRRLVSQGMSGTSIARSGSGYRVSYPAGRWLFIGTYQDSREAFRVKQSWERSGFEVTFTVTQR